MKIFIISLFVLILNSCAATFPYENNIEIEENLLKNTINSEVVSFHNEIGDTSNIYLLK